MKTLIYKIEFLTPCFCAGAKQTHAELRPSAIRGQLRWWFRCLGGSRSEEEMEFGGVHGDNPKTSIFSVRARLDPATGPQDWFTHIPKDGMAPKTYLLGFFCGRTGRLDFTGALPPGSKATVMITFRETPSPKLEQTLRLFFSVGALGFRVTRTAGAFTTDRHQLSQSDWTGLAAELKRAGFTVELLQNEFRDWVELIHRAGSLLKDSFRSREGLNISAGRSGSNPNALGSADPRQASVMHFRPVRIDGKLRLALLEAPHNRILGKKALNAHGNRGPVIDLWRRLDQARRI